MAFKNLFGKFFKDIPEITAKKHEFEQEVQEVAKRYSHHEITLKPENSKNSLFADLYREQFHKWLKTINTSDRRRIIYDILDKYLWRKVKLWEKAERLVEDRLPVKALELIKENNPDDQELEMIYTVSAKINIILKDYDQAILEITKGLEAFPESRHLKIQMADYYYALSDCNKYNEVIKELMQGLPPNGSVDMNVIFDDFFSYHHGKLRSVAFAVNLGFSLANPEQSKIFWERADAEFYFHPIFRLDHAKFILQNRRKDNVLDIGSAFSKYYYLLEEMPWQKEAAINAMALMGTLNIKDERYEFVKSIIDKNGWTSDGMNSFST